MKGIVPRPSSLVAFLSLGVLCLLILRAVYGPFAIWRVYPIEYRSDVLWNLFVVKTVMETGWYYQNPALGAPFGATFLDFAKPETLYLLFFSAAGLVTQNAVAVHNVFYFLGFPVTGWAAMFVLRRGFGLSWSLAVGGGLLYTFLPYHFLRVEHLFLANYFVVPLAVWLLSRAASEHPPFFERGTPGPSRPTVWLLLVLIGSVSIYYAFFTGLLLLTGGVVETLVSRSWRPGVSSACLAGVLALVVIANLTPSIWYRFTHGPNLHVAVRNLEEVETLSLRPVHLLLPSEHHRIPNLAAPAREFNRQAPLINENRTSSLGFLGATGFVVLLLRLLAGSALLPGLPALGLLSRVNALALAIGVTGGLGTLLAVVLSPQFRALNRISVFIAFASIAAVLICLQHALANWRRVARWVLLLIVFTAAAYDQIPGEVVDARADTVAAFDSDRRFVQSLERLLPPEAMVYQWPYRAFPEEPPYSHLRGYLHSARLRWSYGAMNSRPADLWHRHLAALPWDERLRLLRARRFAGIYVDRLALADGGRRLEQELRAAGLSITLESADRHLMFFQLG